MDWARRKTKYFVGEMIMGIRNRALEGPILTKLLVVLGVIVPFIYGATAEAGETLAKIRKSGKITVGTEAAFPPFEFVKDGKIVGYGKDILDYIIADLGVELNQLDVPFQGILPGLLAGKFAFIATTIQLRPERAMKFAFTMPIAEGGSTLLKRKGDNRIKSPDDLNGKVAGTQLGTSSEKTMRALNAKFKSMGKPGFKLNLYTAAPEAYVALANGQLDGVASLLPSLSSLIKERPGVFEIVGPLVEKKTWLGWVTRPEDTELRDYLTKKIKELKDSGKLYELQEKWFGFRMEIPDSGYIPAGGI